MAVMKKDPYVLVSFVSFLLLCFSTCSLSSQPRNPEVEALINIKNELHDPHGVLNNWDEFSVDPCSWTMITCSSDNLVTILGVPSQSLSGTLSASISNLTNLHQVDLSYNNLRGPVPKFPLKTINIAGNPLICRSSPPEICSGSINPSPFSVSLSSSSGKILGRKTNVLAVALGVSLAFAVSVILSLAFIWYRKKQRRLMILRISDKQEEGLLGLGNLKSFSFRELHVATDGFSSKHILGAGGFGNVYRGKLGDGTMVAVKRLKDVNGASGNSQFRTELEMISLAVHRNLLRLIGYCVSSSERLLVYPYMSNGSVASRLKAKPALDWNTRKKIAIGAARGLFYLHEQYWNVDLWKELFTKLLNSETCEDDTETLRSLRKSMEAYICSDPKLMDKLNELLAKQRVSLCSS
ncbi:hypothetical protein DY000_02034285 [Brassica cretica]|uniref:Protein kinase domain-containing protein n=1 Tax=Brassica cretica TaxID=69181 RepID=A0ABQ7DS10_BRACR|nr:hypothetical protein DY000_02034285 [Brassica cretica]